jgi:hypothetical protein
MLENLQNTSLQEPSDCDIILTCVQEKRKRVRLYDPLLQYVVYVLDRRQVFTVQFPFFSLFQSTALFFL